MAELVISSKGVFADGKKVDTTLPKPKDFLSGELIDLRRKGNVIRLYFGKNGDQYGDDWDDTPYEYNAGVVYDKFADFTIDIAFPIEVEIEEPADGCINSEYCRDDFKRKKIYALKVHYYDWENGGDLEIRPAEIYFGDTWGEIKAQLERFSAVTIAGDDPKGWKQIYRGPKDE